MSGTTAGVIATLNSNGEDIDLEFFPGKTLDFTVLWQDSEGNPINISGASAVLQIRDLFGNAIATFNASVNGTAGSLAFSGTPTDTAQINEEGVYEVEMTTSGGDVYRVISGAVTIAKEVSK